MFDYRDPTASGDLERLGALEMYRARLEARYESAARTKGSAFTWLEAFGEADEDDVQRQTLSWRAIPRKAVNEGESSAAIDGARLLLQDEYVEWAVTRGPNGSPVEVVFTTEFREYFEVLARVGVEALVAGILSLYPDVELTVRDLFGIDGNPDSLAPRAREALFLQALRANPVNIGDRLLCLTHENNSLGALFELLNTCGKPRSGDPNAVCSQVACVPERNSDPFICSATQQLAQAGMAVSLDDPVGIRLLELTGIWTFGEREIDINDPAQNEGVWAVERNGRRARLTLGDDLRMDGRRIQSGTQVAANLVVGADVLAAADSVLPAWARMGNEALRQ